MSKLNQEKWIAFHCEHSLKTFYQTKTSFELVKINVVSLGVDSIIVEADNKSVKKESTQQDGTANTLIELLELEKSNKAEKGSETDKTLKTIQKKTKKSKRIYYAVQQSAIEKDQKLSNIYKNVSMTGENNKSLFNLTKKYINQNVKKALVLFISYIVLIGLIVGIPIIVNDVKSMSQVQTEQDWFKTNKLKISEIKSPGLSLMTNPYQVFIGLNLRNFLRTQLT